MAKIERNSILDNSPCFILIWAGFSDMSWNAYPPYSILKAPGPAADMWIFALKLLSISSILGSVNFVVTILKMKHPDLPLMKMPLFSWAILSTALMIITAMPTFSASLIMIYTDRLGVTGFFDLIWVGSNCISTLILVYIPS